MKDGRLGHKRIPPLPDRHGRQRLLTDNHVQQRGMHLEVAVVFDEPELAELVHEVVDA
jgi:hypothetical protein